MPGDVELMTWNVAGRVRAVADQSAAIAAVAPDLVALQEVRATAVAAWTAALGEAGYAHVLTSLPAGVAAPDRARRLGVLIAARTALTPGGALDLPWPERHLLARATTAIGPLTLLNVHAPISSKPGLVKIRTLEAIRDWAGRADTPTVVAGDLNTPQYESREGDVRSFARTRAGAIRPLYGARHDAAELGIVPGLRDHGFEDAFRAVNGYSARDRSWLYPHGRMGYRLDHVFARGVAVCECRYLHDLRTPPLSDHSALWVRLTARRISTQS
jgi:endonuclease/exonuclease/phosphatase family metal-dependent hydrolase